MNRLSVSLCAWWEWLGKNGDQVKVLFAIIAAAYVLVQYQLKERDDKVKRTLEFQVRYGQSEVLASRLRLESYWLSTESEADLSAAKGTPNEKITEVIEKRKLDGTVFMLADFFSQITTCTRHELCDLKTSCIAFKGPIVALRNTYFDLFRKWRKRWGENFIEESHKYFTVHCTT